MIDIRINYQWRGEHRSELVACAVAPLRGDRLVCPADTLRRMIVLDRTVHPNGVTCECVLIGLPTEAT